MPRLLYPAHSLLSEQSCANFCCSLSSPPLRDKQILPQSVRDHLIVGNAYRLMFCMRADTLANDNHSLRYSTITGGFPSMWTTRYLSSVMITFLLRHYSPSLALGLPRSSARSTLTSIATHCLPAVQYMAQSMITTLHSRLPLCGVDWLQRIFPYLLLARFMTEQIDFCSTTFLSCSAVFYCTFILPSGFAFLIAC